MPTNFDNIYSKSFHDIVYPFHVENFKIKQNQLMEKLTLDILKLISKEDLIKLKKLKEEYNDAKKAFNNKQSKEFLTQQINLNFSGAFIINKYYNSKKCPNINCILANNEQIFRYMCKIQF